MLSCVPMKGCRPELAVLLLSPAASSIKRHWREWIASSSWACMSLKICPGPSTYTITKKVHQFLYFLRRLRIFSMSMNALISLLRVYGREHSDRLHHIKFRNSYTQECRSSRVVSINIAGIEWPNHGSELQQVLPQKDSWYPHLPGHSHQQGVQLPKCLDHQIQE